MQLQYPTLPQGLLLGLGQASSSFSASFPPVLVLCCNAKSNWKRISLAPCSEWSQQGLGASRAPAASFGFSVCVCRGFRELRAHCCGAGLQWFTLHIVISPRLEGWGGLVPQGGGMVLWELGRGNPSLLQAAWWAEPCHGYPVLNLALVLTHSMTTCLSFPICRDFPTSLGGLRS